MKDLEEALSALAKARDVHTSHVNRSRFAASVASVSDDHSNIRVKLCTGAFLDVPTSLLKNTTYLGAASQENESWGLASGDIDVSTDAGMLIQQMAHEINRLCRLLQTKRERLEATETNSLSARAEQPSGEDVRPKLDPSDIPLPPQSFKLNFDGVAGVPVTLRYTTPPTQYIAVPYVGHPTWTVNVLYGCFFTKPPLVADPWGFNTWIEFYCDAAHGTPINQHYSAFLTLTVELVQRTT
jgi:hypothetical protein